MLLSRSDADLVFKLFQGLLCFVNQRHGLVPDAETPEKFVDLPLEDQFEVREAWRDDPHVLEAFIDANPFGFAPSELEILGTWRRCIAGQFAVVRHLQKYTVFLHEEKPAAAYGVVALRTPFEDLIPQRLPALVEAVLFPFQRRIVYDGFLVSLPITCGPGLRKLINEDYQRAKQRQGIVESLTGPPLAAAKTRTPKPRTRRATASVTAMNAAHDACQIIVGLIDAFCRDHLNDEYAALCRQLAEQLARKRPSPLVSGQPNSWSAAILRTIGRANFLDDPAQTPHLKLADIDAALGVSSSTSCAKATQIRRLVRIRPFDHRWTLPSRHESSSFMWILEYNGFPMDIRQAPREVQEIAFAKGLIPYIPADRESGTLAESPD
jgi:hypothetical protein